MKSFSPIFLSLMKAADGEREEGRRSQPVMKMKMMKPHAKKTFSLSLEEKNVYWSCNPLFVCLFFQFNAACHRVDLRADAAGLQVMQPLGSLVQIPTVVANKAFSIPDPQRSAINQLGDFFFLSRLTLKQLKAIYVIFPWNWSGKVTLQSPFFFFFFFFKF